MDSYTLTQDLLELRWLIASSTLVFFWACALIKPYRKISFLNSAPRFVKNISFSLLNTFVSYIVVPFTLIEIAKHGIFQDRMISWVSPGGTSLLYVVMGVVILDLVIYWQHRLTHKVPLLWRIHRFHHSDIEIDTTTSGRFHFLEILFSFWVKAAAIIAFNIAPLSVVIFEILLNTTSNFNHSNFHFPRWLEKPLRALIITPELHRIHHSVLGPEMNRNFGFSTSLWDRVFRSYLGTSKDSPQQMKIGLKNFRTEKDQGFINLLLQPFEKS